MQLSLPPGLLAMMRDVDQDEEDHHLHRVRSALYSLLLTARICTGITLHSAASFSFLVPHLSHIAPPVNPINLPTYWPMLTLLCFAAACTLPL